jgi:hypothetical protein
MGSAFGRAHFSAILPLMRSILFAICLLTAPVSGAVQQQPKPEEPIYPITAKGIKSPQTISMPSPDAPSDTPRDKRKVKFTHIAIITGYVGTDGPSTAPRSSSQPVIEPWMPKPWTEYRRGDFTPAQKTVRP